MRINLVIHLLTKVWQLVLCISGSGDRKSCVLSNTYFDKDEAQFKIFRNHSDCFSPMSWRDSFIENNGPRTAKSDANAFVLPCDTALDAAFRMLAGFVFCALHSLFSNCHLFHLLDKLILEWDHIRNLEPTSTTIPAFLASFPDQALQILRLNITQQAGIAVLGVENDGTVVGQELKYISVFRRKNLSTSKLVFWWTICVLETSRGVSKQ